MHSDYNTERDELSDEDIKALTSLEFRDRLGSPTRQRSQPPVTGKGVCIREIKAKREELQQLQQEVKDAKEIAVGKCTPFDYTKPKTRRRMAELEEETTSLHRTSRRNY